MVGRGSRWGWALLVGGTLAWLVAGCGATVDVDDRREDGAGGEAPADGAGGSADDDGVPAAFCADACAVTAEWGCLEADACVAVCEEERAGWTTEVAAAFAACVADNPLCFESLEGCMLEELHPPGTVHTIRLRGEGLREHEGRAVHAWNDHEVPFRGESVVRDGAFELTWTEPVAIWDERGPLLLLYVDVDGDGACRPEVDVTEATNAQWNGDLLEPVFEAVVAPPLGDGDFVCGGAD